MTFSRATSFAVLLAFATASVGPQLSFAQDTPQTQIDDALELIQAQEAQLKEARDMVAVFKAELQNTRATLAEAQRTYVRRQLVWGAAAVGLLAGSAYLVHKVNTQKSSMKSSGNFGLDFLMLPFAAMESLLKAAPYIAGATVTGTGALVAGSMVYMNQKQLNTLSSRISSLEVELERAEAEMSRRLELLCKMKKALGVSC